jgi:aldose 1-epimerase
VWESDAVNPTSDEGSADRTHTDAGPSAQRVAELRAALLAGRGPGASAQEVARHTRDNPWLTAAPAPAERARATHAAHAVHASHAPSGEQFEIVHGDQRATIVEVGGGVRRYDVGDDEVLEPYPVDQMCDGAHGAPLVPWPNRLGGGRYRFDGTEHQVALTEPEKDNAIHGFLRWRSWGCLEHHEDSVVMATTLFPLQGYPFTLEVRVRYALDDDGLTVTTTATNVGQQAAPYACGQHPYLSAGRGLVDDCTLELDARTRIVTDPQRQLPTGTEAVAGTPFDFRRGTRIGELAVDDAFTDLGRDADGRAWVSLTRPDGRVVSLWVDESYPFLEIYTGDTLAPDRQRRGLGAEPMTGAPNALQSGDGLIRLESGETFTAQWGVTVATSSSAGEEHSNAGS